MNNPWVLNLLLMGEVASLFTFFIRNGFIEWSLFSEKRDIGIKNPVTDESKYMDGRRVDR